jgi:hypothetical protein
MAERINDFEDPFSGGVKTPALSFKDVKVGGEFILRVTEPATLVQGRDYDTSQPAYWDEEKTQPKMCAVITGRVINGPNSVGEHRSVWAKKPSSLFVAIAEAQAKAGVRIAKDGILHIKFAGETKHENKRFNAIKNYTAEYTAPDPLSSDEEDEETPY